MLRVSDVSKRLGVSVALVYELVAKGKLACYRIGLGRGAIRFQEADIQAYLESCRVEGEEAPRPRPTLRHIKLS